MGNITAGCNRFLKERGCLVSPLLDLVVLGFRGDDDKDHMIRGKAVTLGPPATTARDTGKGQKGGIERERKPRPLLKGTLAWTK